MAWGSSFRRVRLVARRCFKLEWRRRLDGTPIFRCLWLPFVSRCRRFSSKFRLTVLWQSNRRVRAVCFISFGGSGRRIVSAVSRHIKFQFG